MAVLYSYIKIYEKLGEASSYYAEHADGTAYLTKDLSSATRFASQLEAERVASTLMGGKVRSVYSGDGWAKPVTKS